MNSAPIRVRVLLTTLVVVTNVGVCAQGVAHDPNVWGGDGDYNDLWRPNGNVAPDPIRAVRAFPRGTPPLSLRLAFDENSNHVLVEWKSPKHILMTHYQLRMKKADSRQWGRWHDVGPASMPWGSAVIHDVDPGATYEVEVRARNDRIAGPPASGSVTIPAPSEPS